MPRFLENLLESEYLVCGATAKTKTGYPSVLVQLALYKAFGVHLSREAKEGDSPIVYSFLSALLCIGMTNPVC